MGDEADPLSGVTMKLSHIALEKLAKQSAEALRYFEAEDYDTAAACLSKCRDAMNTLAKVRRDMKASEPS